MNVRNQSKYKVFNVNASSLSDLVDKGVGLYINLLYNPGGFFSEAHVNTGNKKDTELRLNKSIKVHYIKKFGFYPMGFIYSILQMKKIIKKSNINIIRAFGPYHNGLQAILVGKLSGKKVVASLGGDNRLAQNLSKQYAMHYKFLTEFTEKFVLKHSNLVICCNKFTRDYCVRLGIDPKKIRIISKRIDMDFFYPNTDGTKVREELDLNTDPLILYVGRMELDKQIDSLIECMPYVVSKVPNVKFLYIGSGTIKKRIIQRVEEMGMSKYSIFKDFEPTKRIAAFMAASDVVVVPMSIFVILEAAASGKPIVAYDVEWHSEFIKDGKTGLLVENRNEKELADAIVNLLQNKDYAKRLGENARKKMEDEYSNEKLVKKEVDAYLELLE